MNGWDIRVFMTRLWPALYAAWIPLVAARVEDVWEWVYRSLIATGAAFGYDTYRFTTTQEEPPEGE